ncbi:metallophosphoesterase family protein [Stygiolobus caldivivus]|uniref:Metallophosphoesterase n=1 Tax=Stygiolobus caldivivus TaxID=2824673 RepID=A0A8D5ZJV5_9CREN|nr:metallophosphoesterase [Stygiolobus caldivivus]BCU71041.1 metallophosphoesterase [Stygiolobus caldivivus]
MGLFKKNSNKSVDKKGEQVKILFTSDIHGSDIVFRKFLNAGLQFKVDAFIIGGDLAGKALYAIVDLGNGKYKIEGREIGKEGLSQVTEEIRKKGEYYTIVSEKEYEEMQYDKELVNQKFREAMENVVRGWIKIAEEKLKGTNIPVYVNLGNDDPEYLFAVIEESEIMRKCEGDIIEIGDHEMISYGYVNPTPWHTPREKDEDTLYRNLKEMADKVRDQSRAIYNLHAPPYNTHLDNAPLLDQNLKPVVKGGEIVFTHVGSTSVRRIIEEYQPLVGLHGHIHESKGFDKLGRTMIFNPGSEYSEGILHSLYLVLEGDKVKTYMFRQG